MKKKSRPLAIYIKTNLGDINASDELYDECDVKNMLIELRNKNICFEERARFGHFKD